MIESLTIDDLGVIEHADLALSPGLTALTGETGAGKTMVLTSLGLLLGQRAESSIVRHGCEHTRVQGVFLLDADSRPGRRAIDAGAQFDDDALLAARTVPAQGRSRAYLGGQAVPSAVLTHVGSDLVAVHGQADQLRLRSAAAQRAAVDSFGGTAHAALCRDYAQAYRAHHNAVAELERWHEGAAQRSEDVAQRRRWIDLIDALDPQPGEDTALAAEATRLDRTEDLRRAAQGLRSALAGADEGTLGSDTDATSLILHAQRGLEPVADVDQVLTGLYQRVQQLAIDAADIAAEAGDYLAGIDADPQRLAWIQQRRADLARLVRDLPDAAGVGEGDHADVLIDVRDRARHTLDEIDGPYDTADQLSHEVERTRTVLMERAADLSAARRALAHHLQTQVSDELEGLQMHGAQLLVTLEELDEPGPTGAEHVILLLSAHPGAAPLPLGKGASGGELSRIMLALEVVLAQATPSTYRRTLVFDEIDAGVGGKAAREIGRRLARLARTHQVVVVTHLAQVAAWADTHLVVRKETGAGANDAGLTATAQSDSGAPDTTVSVTRTQVESVTDAQRVRELARMLSGHEDSDAALRHAAELLEEARMAQSPL